MVKVVLSHVFPYLDKSLDLSFQIRNLLVLAFDGDFFLIGKSSMFLFLLLQVLDLIVQVADLLLDGFLLQPFRGNLCNKI